jgi:hypothetical protein
MIASSLLIANVMVRPRFGCAFPTWSRWSLQVLHIAMVKAAEACRMALRICDIADTQVATIYDNTWFCRPDGHVAWRGENCAGDGA